MSTSHFLGHTVDEFGRVVYDITTNAGKTALITDMEESESYDTFSEPFQKIDTPENVKAIWAGAIKALGPSVIRTDFEKWFRRVLISRNSLGGTLDWSVNDEVPEVLDQTPEEEFERFWESHSFEQRRTRKLTDPAYAEWERIFAAGQFSATAPPDAVNVPVAQPQGEPHAALRKFAASFLKASRSSLRPLNGKIRLGSEEFTPEKFERLVAEATAARLI